MMAAQTKILAAQTSSKIAQLTDTNFLWFCWYGVAGWPCMTSNKLFYNWVSCFSGSIFVKAAVNPSASRMSVPSIYCLQKQKKLWTVGCQFVYPSLPKCTSMLFFPLNARLSAIYHLPKKKLLYYLSFAIRRSKWLPGSLSLSLIRKMQKHVFRPLHQTFFFFLPLCANTTASIPYTGMPLSMILFLSLQSAAANLSCTGFLVYLPFVYHLQNGATMNITATGLPVNCSTSPSFQ